MLATSVPALALSIYISVISGSLSVIAIILDTAVAQTINLVNYFVLRTVSRGNVFKYPYGTGKLEDFAGFAYGWSILFVCGIIIYEGIYRFIGPPPLISLGLALLAVIFSLARITFIVGWLRRILRRNPGQSPLLHIYYINCSGIMWYTAGILVAMVIGWFLTGRWGNTIAVVIDLLIAVAYSLYLLVTGVGVIRANFRALLDLPLSEPDQLAILNVLTQHYDRYANVVNVLTRQSGGRKRIEIELSFPPEDGIQQIEMIRSRMREDLEKHFGEIDFTLIARGPDKRDSKFPAVSPGGGP
ncbi:MAG: cation diffusion facilitator family transporter [Deltaproteobacteria bacterium]